jgi:hypothetical protein
MARAAVKESRGQVLWAFGFAGLGIFRGLESLERDAATIAV